MDGFEVVRRLRLLPELAGTRLVALSGYADEATLFRLAGQLEREAPWAGRRPGLWA